MSNEIKARSQIAAADKWAIEDLYPSDEAWSAALPELDALAARLPAFQGRISQSADALLEYLRLNDEMTVLTDRLGSYAFLRQDEDTRDAAHQAMMGSLMKRFVAIEASLSFFLPELLSVDDARFEAFYAEKPELEAYRRYLTRLRRKKAHVLSPAEEKLLAAAGEMAQTPSESYKMFDNADVKFQPAADSEGALHAITQGSYVSLLESQDRTLRRNAFENYYASYDAYRNTVASMLAGQVKQLEFFANARNYPASLDASLDETEVPTSVYRNLIEAVHQNMDKMHRYVRLRKKLLGVDELHFYDIYAPLLSGMSRKIPFAEAKQTVEQALHVMGEDYLKILREGFENRWIDVYENEGKRSGAYSAGTRVHPYVLLNYTGTIDSEFTLAHEMGHAIHSYLSLKTQPVINSEYVIFVAEVASTCNEALLMDYLLKKTTDKRERAYLLNHFLEQFKSTLYRQTMFAEFELKIAELNAQGVTLTADALCKVYRELNELYFGPDMVIDPQIALEWARIPHFYRNYYVFQYATGYSAAIALSQRILREGESAVRDYFGFLSGGCSKTPIELLKGAGVDMTTAQPVNDALALFGTLLDEMEELTR